MPFFFFFIFTALQPAGVLEHTLFVCILLDETEGGSVMERNIIGSRFLDQHAFQVLTNKADKNDQEIIEDLVRSCTTYVSDVDVGETQIRRFYATLDGAELQEKVMAVDQRRRRHHETAIANCKMINRLAACYGISPVFTGDPADRLQVADFCLDVTVTLFEGRSK